MSSIKSNRIAHSGKIFVISSSGHFSQEMIDSLCNTKEEKGRIQAGGGCSTIIGVNGEFLGGPLYDQEGIVYADINLEDITQAKLKQDVLGHYSRFDMLSLNFNDQKLAPIHYVQRAFQENDSGSAVASLQTKIERMEQRLNLFLEKREEERD